MYLKDPNIIASLTDQIRTLQDSNEKAVRDMIDYYTVWVHQIKTPISAMHLLLDTQQFPQKSEVTMELFKIEQYVEMVLQSLRLFSHSSDYVIKKCPLENIVKQTIRKYAKLFKTTINKIQINESTFLYMINTPVFYQYT